ncbi:hypothetical protein B0H14DRAFT_2810854, partial [Mycena olivaceomarginata]
MDIDNDITAGMASVARWTAAGESRREAFREKINNWVKSLLFPAQTSLVFPHQRKRHLFRALLPHCLQILTLSLQTSSAPLFSLSLASKSKNAPHPFAIPFPLTSGSGSKSPIESTIAFPQTPSLRLKRPERELTTRTPRTSVSSVAEVLPQLAVHQRGATAETVPKTPSFSSRREALYRRLHQRSLSASPTKAASSEMLKTGQDELRRRCLLGRLGGIAESVWMRVCSALETMFSTPAPGSTASPTARKRRALPMSEVTTAVVKSSPVPISSAEAVDSLVMLAKRCPFFLKKLTIAGEEWLEMPAPSTESTEGSPSKKSLVPRSVIDSADAVVTRSPWRVKREGGGLREVREIIRRELDSWTD